MDVHAAVNNKVKKEGKNAGRQSGKEKTGCGFFLWRDEAKIRELKALSSAGKSSNTATPSRPLRQKKIPDTFTVFQKPGKPGNAKRNSDNAEITKAGDVVICLSDSTDTNDDPAPAPRSRKNKHSDDDEGNERTEKSRKAARTPNNTSPSKLLLMQETMASSTSFTSTSTIPDETPSSRFRKLNIATPATKARIQAEQRFDQITPVKKPNFRSFSSTPSATTLTDISDPFWSNAPPPSTAVTTPGRSLSCADEIVDIHDPVFSVLKVAGVSLEPKERGALETILKRPVQKQKGYLAAFTAKLFHRLPKLTLQLISPSRDKIRETYKNQKTKNDVLESENAKLVSKVDSLEHQRKSDEASLKSHRAEISRLQKANADLEIDLQDAEERASLEAERAEKFEEENARLQARLTKLEEEFDALG
ncbi:hypothetical protein Dda_7539 [Drechslerella dactyloides]|uniref:Uncharacterized protein n=1 Tax=Drechslerella dactyloides TaxID=74499 RepID=A0AAD6ISD2_DREDA|nr:hypothetical protein Dda_7539 [Drechslerella dactyloides]